MECPACHSPLIADAAFCPRCGAHIDGAPRYDEYAYEAFISYKHHKRDGALAKRIQRAIEGRRLPRDIGGNRAGERLGKCFRDEDELHSSDSLPALIEDALKHARYLIVICSPEMRASAWVAREVELFASYHGRDRILPVLAEGEPADSFPPLLMTRLEPEGDAYVERPAEPLAADMRDSSYKHFSAEVLRLVAPIAGCGYDDLRQRERTRRLTRIAMAAAATAAAAVAFGAFALFQQTQIQANLDAALKNESEYLAEEAMTILEQGDRLQAAQVALHALGDNEDNKRPYTPSARLALEEACQVYPGNYWRPVYANYEDQGFFDDIELSRSNAFYAIRLANFDIRVYDVKTGLATCTISHSKRDDNCMEIAFVGETLLAAYSHGTVEGYDPATGDRLFCTELGIDTENYVFPSLITPPPNGSVAAVTSFNSDSPSYVHVSLIDAEIGSEQGSWDLSASSSLGDYEYTSIQPFPAAFSPDGETFVQALGNAVAVLDRSDGTWETYAVDSGVTAELRIEDALYLATFDEGDTDSCFHVERYDLDTHARTWNHDLAAVTTTLTEDVFHPILATVIEHAGSRLLPVAYNDRILYLSCHDGSVVLDVPTGDRVETLAHATTETGLAYVSGGRISTAYDPFGMSDIASLGVTNAGKPTSGPSSYGGEDDTGAVGIKLFNIDNESYCLLADADENRTLVYRYDLKQLDLPGRTELDEHTKATCHDGDHMLRSTSGTYRAILDDVETDSITFYDGNTFEAIATVPLSALPRRTEIGSDSFFTTECEWSEAYEELLYVILPDSSLIALDATTGTVVGSHDAPEGDLLSAANLAQHNDELLYIAQDYNDETHEFESHLVHLDAQSLEEHSRTAIQLSAQQGTVNIQELAIVGSRAIVRWEAYKTNRVNAIDVETGKEVDASIARNLSDSYRNLTFATDREHSRLVLGLDDTLTLYDRDLNEQWSFRTDGAQLAYANVVSDGSVIVQSTTGELTRLDGATGAVIAATTTLPDDMLAQDAWTSSDGEHLYIESYAGVLAINLDPEAFDVESYIRCGAALSQDEQSVLVRDDYDAYILPTYTTDELIDYAQDIIEGHGLTREEQRRYHIE